MTFTLYAARHGQTEANVARRYPGHSATALTPLGERQAREMGMALKRELGSRPALFFVSSPLLRARATMRLIRDALGLPPDDFAVDPRLRDIDHGDWTGLTDDEVRARDPEGHRRHHADKWNVPMAGGECYDDLATRIREFLGDLGGDAVTVSLGAATQMLRGLSAGMDPAQIIALDEPHGVVFRVRGGAIDRLDPG